MAHRCLWKPREISVEDEGPDEPAYDLEPSVLGTPPDLSFMSLGGLLQNACQFVFPKQCDDPEGWARRFRVSSAGAVHIFRWKIDCCHSHRKIQSFGASRLTSISLSPQCRAYFVAFSSGNRGPVTVPCSVSSRSLAWSQSPANANSAPATVWCTL